MEVKDLIYKKDKYSAVQDIINFYKKNKYAIINFIYFFNLLKILENKDENYFQYLKTGNFLLPDGIALRLYFKRKYNISLKNLNGTDFIPFFIDYLNKNNIKFQIFLYGASKKNIEKVYNKFNNKWNIVYFKNGYEPLNIKEIESYIKSNLLNIFLIGIGTPKQEKWLYENKNWIKTNNLIAFSVGGLFDFLSGEEKRAPKIIRNLNLEWFRRATTKPKKNLKKTLNSFKLIKYLIKG